MKMRFFLRKPAFLLLASFISLPLGAYGARSAALRYRPTSGQTNVYHIQIETRGETGVDILEGDVLLIPKAGPSNVITLTLRGMLNPRRDPSRPGSFPGMPYGRWMGPVSLGEGCEIQMDDRGNLLRIQGDPPLPVPAGSVAQLLVESFPASSESRWETTRETAVIDNPVAVGPARAFPSTQPFGAVYYGGFNPRMSQAIVLGTQKTKYETRTASAGTMVIAKKVSFSSHLQQGAESCVSGSASGEAVFDVKTGFLRSAEFQCEATASTDAVTRRTTGSWRVKLLEGAERDTALARAYPYGGWQDRPQRKITSAELESILTDLNSDAANVRQSAALRLQSASIPEPSPALLEKMVALLADPDPTVRGAAAKVVADHGTTEHVPVLLKLLKSGEPYNRQAVIGALARLKDPRAIEPLVAAVARGTEGYQATEALGKFGPQAEDAVLTLLQQKNVETLRSACSILKVIGTEKSLEPLKQLMLDPDQSLSSGAGDAFRAVSARL